jgi:transcription elongation factor GreA
MTRKGYDFLLDKIEKLEMELKSKLKALGKEAEQDFDLPENPTWKQLQVEIGYNLPQKISELKDILSQAQIIEYELQEQLGDNETVRLGSRARIQFEDEDDDKVFVLVGPFDTDVVENGVSYLSPLGSALLGARLDEERFFNAPKGKRLFVVLDIEKGL